MAEDSLYPFGVSGPAHGAFAITPSDSATLQHTTRGIYIGGAGNLYVLMYSGESVLFTGVLAGTYLPLVCTKVYSTNTTATSLVGLWR